MSRSLPDDMRVYREICAAADANKPCPSNPEIAGMLGKDSVSAGVSCLARLAERGLITVRRYQITREVTVVATGRSTYVHPSQAVAHWRDRPDGQTTIRPACTPVAQRLHHEREPEVDDADRVNRDPCPRCGIRADVGCHHSHNPISMGAFA